ncbi:MAG: DUF368 domain-containing protein [Thermotoga sp.]|nr:MAG: DUF368 domain-containing protein [Thermotoga sp.]
MANLIPGVSGGTMAVITGIYEELISSISDLMRFKVSKKKLFFLIIVSLGMVVSIFSLSSLMDYLLKNHEFLTYSFFFGLIIGAIPNITRKMKRVKVISFLLGLFLVLIPGFPIWKHAQSNPGFPTIILSGYLGIGAMILPGFSGSLLLLILGTYDNLISAISEMDVKFLAIFSLGMILGLLSFVKIIEYAMKKYPMGTKSFILGLIVGSLYMVNPFKFGGDNFKLDDKTFLSCVVFILLGVMLIISLEKLANSLRKSN